MFLGTFNKLVVDDRSVLGGTYGLQDLVTAPAVAPLAQSSRTAAEDVLQGPSLQAQRASW